jgi:hypothetical protein
MTETKPASIYGTQPDVEIFSRVRARALRRGMELALVLAACWYVAWFLLPIAVTPWAGVFVLVVAAASGFWISRTMMLRHVADEFRRRKELLAFGEKHSAQINSTN